MKKMMMTLMAAVLISASAIAQEEKQDKSPEKKFDKTEMVKRRTERTVKQYNLTDKQAKQLLELNNKYADKMEPRGGRHHHGPKGGPERPPRGNKDGKCQCPEAPKDGKRQAPPKDDEKRMEHRKQMEETMKAYDAELKKIMRDEQYKAYQADMEKHREHRPHKK